MAWHGIVWHGCLDCAFELGLFDFIADILTIYKGFTVVSISDLYVHACMNVIRNDGIAHEFWMPLTEPMQHTQKCYYTKYIAVCGFCIVLFVAVAF